MKKLLMMSILSLVGCSTYAGGFALTGGYDTMLGDQWGLAVAGNNFFGYFTAGGFITSAAASDAADATTSAFNNRYGSGSGSIEGDATTWSLGVAFLNNQGFGDEVNGAYYGIGLAGADVTSSGRLQNSFGDSISGRGTLSEMAGDLFAGFIAMPKNGPYFDLRFGYRLSIESSISVRSGSFRFEGELEDPVIEGFYGTVTIGWSW